MASTSVDRDAASVGRVERFHPLDWMRVLAIGGVFLVHVLHPFDTFDWHVKDTHRSELLSLVVLFLSSWGLGFFFLVAGAAASFSMGVRSTRAYLRERVDRLLVPFVAGYLLLSPTQAFIEETHAGEWHGSFLSFVPPFFERVWEQLISVERGFQPLLVGWNYHLWFLVFLMWFSLLIVPFAYWWRRSGGRALDPWLSRRLHGRGTTLLFALPLATVHVAVRAASAAEHAWGDFAFSFGFFVLGYILFLDRRYTEAIRRDMFPALVVATTGFFLLIATGTLEWALAWSEHPSYSWTYAWTLTLVSVQAWAWTVVALSLALRVPLFRRPMPRSLGSAVMPFYLLHQPVILCAAFLVVRTPWDLPVKLATLIIGSLVATSTLILVAQRARPPHVLRLAPDPRHAGGTTSVQPVCDQPIGDESERSPSFAGSEAGA